MKLLLRLEQHKVEPKTKPIRIKMRISGVDICSTWQEILNILKDEEIGNDVQKILEKRIKSVRKKISKL